MPNSKTTEQFLRAGKYKMRQGRGWLAVTIRVECPTDDEGRLADRPRLVLYVGAERHPRPLYRDWGSRLWPCSDAEHWRLSHAHDATTAAPGYDNSTAPSLF